MPASLLAVADAHHVWATTRHLDSGAALGTSNAVAATESWRQSMLEKVGG